MKKSLVFCLLLASSSASQANEVNCPSIKAIQNASITNVVKNPENGKYIVQINENFDTDMAWNFLMTDITADNESDAVTQVKQSLKNYSLIPGPNEFNMCGFISYKCQYQDQAGHTANASA